MKTAKPEINVGDTLIIPKILKQKSSDVMIVDNRRA